MIRPIVAARILVWLSVVLTVVCITIGVLVSPTEGQEPQADGVSQAASSSNYLPGGDGELERSSMMARKRGEDASDWSSRAMSVFGIFGFIFLAWLASTNRRAVKWKLVAVGTALQLGFAIFILWTPIGKALFEGLNDAVMVLLDFTKAGSDFLFRSLVSGQVETSSINIAFAVLPTIIFFSSLMTVLYHLGIMQVVVRWMSGFMLRFMGTSGAETLSASANIFVGQTEAPLVIKPYVDTMTRSELMAVMTGGFATVAGGVLAAYVAILSPYFPDIAGHLIAASVMSAPAALVIAKIMLPETEESQTMGSVKLIDERPDANIIDAAARGAGDGMRLTLNVGAMLLAFIALVALCNYMVSLPSRMHNEETLDNVNHYLASAALPVAPGCDVASSGDDIIRCTHQGLLAIAAHHDVAVSEKLTALDGEEDARIRTVEALGVEVTRAVEELRAEVTPLHGSVAQADCAQGRVAACGAMLTLTQSERWTVSLHEPDLWPFITLEALLGWLFFPLALLMGIPWDDCHLVGQLLGEKMVLNEFIAYLHLSDIIGTLHYRSIVVCTYALCGFANFGSIAIQIGGIGGIAPRRRQDLARLGLRAMIGGTLAAFMTATIAGALI